MISWNIFINGEAELKCQSIDDAKLLLDVCKENKIDCNNIKAVDYKEKPYWYIKDDELCITRYCCESESICSCWTVKTFSESHAY